ncbi:MAG: hypothetical protein ACYTF0_08925, partial [Planctomycetota bacterium]
MPRPLCSLTLLACLCGSPLLALDVPTPPAGPWEDSWTIDLRGSERVMIDYRGSSYLVIAREDLSDSEFLSGKDVLLPLKFATFDLGQARFYHVDNLHVHGA